MKAWLKRRLLHQKHDFVPSSFAECGLELAVESKDIE
jgi:hypothetical protein